MKLIFDTYAWIEYFLGTEKGKKVDDYLKDNEIITPILVIIELNYKADKEGWNFESILDFIKSKSTISFINWDIAKISGKNYLEQRKRHKDFSLIDAIILSTAKVHNSKILTGDKHFIGLDETTFLD